MTTIRIIGKKILNYFKGDFIETFKAAKMETKYWKKLLLFLVISLIISMVLAYVFLPLTGIQAIHLEFYEIFNYNWCFIFLFSSFLIMFAILKIFTGLFDEYWVMKARNLPGSKDIKYFRINLKIFTLRIPHIIFSPLIIFIVVSSINFWHLIGVFNALNEIPQTVNQTLIYFFFITIFLNLLGYIIKKGNSATIVNFTRSYPSDLFNHIQLREQVDINKGRISSFFGFYLSMIYLGYILLSPFHWRVIWANYYNSLDGTQQSLLFTFLILTIIFAILYIVISSEKSVLNIMNEEFRKNPLGTEFSPTIEINKSRKKRIIYFISFLIITSIGPLFFRIVLNSIISLIVFLTVQWILHCSSNYLKRIEKDSNILLPHRKFTLDDIPEIKDSGILVVILEDKVDLIKVNREESLDLKSYIFRIDKYKKIYEKKNLKNNSKMQEKNIEFYYFFSCLNIIRLYQLWISLITRHRITNYKLIKFSKEVEAELKEDHEFFIIEAKSNKELRYFMDNMLTEWKKYVFNKYGELMFKLEDAICDHKQSNRDQQNDTLIRVTRLYNKAAKKKKKIEKLGLKSYFESIKNKLIEKNFIQKEEVLSNNV